MSYLFNNEEEYENISCFNETLIKQPYMSYRIQKSKLKNSLFNTNNLISLPKDINFITDVSASNYGEEDIEEYEEESDDEYNKEENEEENEEENKEKSEEASNDDEYDDTSFWIKNKNVKTSMHHNIRCATKLPYESVDKYTNHVCKCNNDESCKINYKNLNYYCCPAVTYNGKNLVKCKCDENIITKIINDWKYLYELNNIDILLYSIDDYGNAQVFHIVIIDNKINIHYSDGFYGI